MCLWVAVSKKAVDRRPEVRDSSTGVEHQPRFGFAQLNPYILAAGRGEIHPADAHVSFRSRPAQTASRVSRTAPAGHFETFAKNASYMGGLREGWIETIRTEKRQREEPAEDAVT